MVNCFRPRCSRFSSLPARHLLGDAMDAAASQIHIFDVRDGHERATGEGGLEDGEEKRRQRRASRSRCDGCVGSAPVPAPAMVTPGYDLPVFSQVRNPKVVAAFRRLLQLGLT